MGGIWGNLGLLGRKDARALQLLHLQRRSVLWSFRHIITRGQKWQ